MRALTIVGGAAAAIVATAFAERPETPSIRALCGEAHSVVIARHVATEEFKPKHAGVPTDFVTFELVETLKGEVFGVFPVPQNGDATVCCVVIPDTSAIDCFVQPRFEPGTQYVLFLTEQIGPATYARILLDQVWGERTAADDTVAAVRAVLDDSKR